MIYIENQLSYEDYCELRSSVEWLNFAEKQTRKALRNSLYTITVQEDSGADTKGELSTEASSESSIGVSSELRTIAMGRLVGDGLYYLIVDVVVRPECQGRGIGNSIMDKLLAYVEAETPEGGRSSVQLIAEKGKEDFYLKKGFKLIPHEYCGSGMRKVIRK